MTEKAKKLGDEPINDVLKSAQTERGIIQYDYSFGLTKREYFAGLAMQGLLSNPERYKYIADKVSNGMSNNDASAKNAHKAVLLADALLEELAKE